ncbi:CNNM domain-containing protein [Stratiformator vulcanicus]|uniref:Magnesium and cobalt efflux protein CorC n=1 Tax=Stratiformator vulcanicus TaxID=2527980 RepID=A0A517R6T8_9PLAN|nr:CNNM domain-containing protein [Stratiformator vulcanicus]QDT39600.1 Magnesium and cobalt efflux protein CorC [Stratiformator vulcanicus]
MWEFFEAASLWFPWSLGMLCLIGFSGFFSSSETALFFLSPTELRAMRVGSPAEKAASDLMADANRVLTAILFWNLLINLTYFVLGVVVAQRLATAGMATAAAIYGILSLAAIILFGEVLPKSIAVVFRRRAAVALAFPLTLTVRVLDPVTPALAEIANSLRRMFWPRLQAEPFLKAEDLEQAVEALTDRREITDAERKVIHNALDLSDWTAEESMWPRGSYLTLPTPIRWADLDGRMPPGDFVAVRAGDTTEIEQIVPLRDLVDVTEPLETRSVKLVHVPWCARLADVLQELGPRGGAASVINEHGETIGVLMLEDLIDTVVVAEASRARRILRREPVINVGGGVFHIEGVVSLRTLSHTLGVPYDFDDDANWTVGGLIADQLDRIPVRQDTIRWNGYELRVIDATSREVKRIAAIPLKPPPGIDGGASVEPESGGVS